MSDAEVTKHGRNRAHQRTGLPRRTIDRNAERALKAGIARTDTRGALRRYLDKLYYSHDCAASNIRVYCGYVYIFNGDILITVLILPQEYRRTALKEAQKGRNNALYSEGLEDGDLHTVHEHGTHGVFHKHDGDAEAGGLPKRGDDVEPDL